MAEKLTPKPARAFEGVADPAYLVSEIEQLRDIAREAGLGTLDRGCFRTTIGARQTFCRPNPAFFVLFRWLATAYVEVFRNIPLLVQMFLWFFVLPEVLPARVGPLFEERRGPSGVRIRARLCLGFYTASRVAEQVRSGIQSIHRSVSRARSSEVNSWSPPVPILFALCRFDVPSRWPFHGGHQRKHAVNLLVGIEDMKREAKHTSTDRVSDGGVFETL